MRILLWVISMLLLAGFITAHAQEKTRCRTACIEPDCGVLLSEVTVNMTDKEVAHKLAQWEWTPIRGPRVTCDDTVVWTYHCSMVGITMSQNFHIFLTKADEKSTLVVILTAVSEWGKYPCKERKP